MKMWIKRLALSALLATGMAVYATAQEPVGPPQTKGNPAVQPVPLGEPLPVGNAGCCDGSGPGGNGANGGRGLGFFNRHGFRCANDPGYPGCSTVWAQLRFMFGSCRTFFGEPCQPRPRVAERRGLDVEGH